MAPATVTVRELKNKDTGIDLSVPSYNETPGLITKVVEYEVVVVTKLQVFKSPKHKDTDTVQFTVQHKFDDFQYLHVKLHEKFSGTVFPSLPKRTLVVNDKVIIQRRAALDAFVKFIAKTSKLSVHSLVLEFLGVNAIKAGKFRREKTLEKEEEKYDDNDSSSEDDKKEEELVDSQDDSKTKDAGLFDEDEEEDLELFGGKVDEVDPDPEPESAPNDTPLSETEISSDPLNIRIWEDTKPVIEPPIIELVDKTDGVEADKLFAEQDLGGAVNEDDDLFAIVPDAKQTTAVNLFDDIEDNSDLFNIADDLERFMKIDKKEPQSIEKPAQKPTASIQPEVPSHKPDAGHNRPTEVQAKPDGPTEQQAKPQLGKPSVPQGKPIPPKRKPKLADKPAVSTKPNTSAKPAKPSIPSKPIAKPKPTVPKQAKHVPSNDSTDTTMGTDDIMKYIQENTEQGDLDLF